MDSAEVIIREMQAVRDGPLSRVSSDKLLSSPTMDILKMLAELRAQRDQLDEAILTLTRLASGSGTKRRGRPPAWLTAAVEPATMEKPERPRKKFSAATRRKMAQSQKKRWAAKRAGS
jgi:hypothetical protein